MAEVKYKALALVRVRLAPGSRAAEAPGAPSLVRSAAAGPLLIQEEDVGKLDRWLITAGFEESLKVRTHELHATWHFPLEPAIHVALDGDELAAARPIRAFAGQAWLLEWQALRAPLQLMQLASFVPEELDPDPAMRDFALAVALDAVAKTLAPDHAADS